MKTKLLKIVRKRFSITRYDSIPQNTDHILYREYKNKPLPLFVVTDTKNEHTFDIHKSFENAHRYLVWLIRQRYIDQMNRKTKTEKVWYKH